MPPMQGHPRSGLRRLLCAAGLLPSLPAALLLQGCESQPPPDPPVLRFSAIPDQSAAQVLGQHVPLMDRICAAVQRRCQWVPVDSYEALVERFGRGQIDLAYFGAVTFAQAWERHGALPLAMRDVDFRFTSVVVVRRASPLQGLDDLRQRDFSFGNRSSTSGHFMLRQRLAGENVVPERYFRSVQYASDHDAAMRAVVQGTADAAGVNATVFYRRVAAADPAAAALRVVWQTPPFVDYVWAARPQLSAPLRRRLVDAFLDLDLSLPADRPALQAEGAAGFVPAFPHDFEEVRSVLRTQGSL
jgi:phosphonate transport system substrate-binding protein